MYIGLFINFKGEVLMKYLLLDTNVYIDLMISRRKDLKDSHFTLIKKLIDSDEVKIIMPEIVKHELERNIKLEILSIKKMINEAKKAIDAISWPYVSDEYREFSESQNKIVKSLNVFKDKATAEEHNHITKLLEKFQEIFDHKNVISISETSDMLENIRKKEIYKICPFHIADKSSYGDALIIEILLRSKEILNLNDNDKIYFISRNFKDFSSKVNKSNIHEDLEAEIEKLGLSSQIEYSINFVESLLNDFETEIENAKIHQELLEVQRLTKIMHIEEYYETQKEMLREMAGIKPLMDPFSYYEEINQEKEIISLFESLQENSGHYISKLENMMDEIEKFEQVLMVTDESVLVNNIIEYNNNSPFLTISPENIEGIKMFFKNNIISKDIVEISIDSLRENLTVSENEVFSIMSHNNEIYELIIVNDLYIEEDGIDEIYLNFMKDKRTLESAVVNLYYGFAVDNGDGSVGDAQDFYCEAFNVEKVKEVFEQEIEKNKIELDEILSKISIFKAILTKI